MTSYRARARYYDAEYSFSGDKSFLSSLVTSNVRNVLEIPCGSGRNIWLTDTKRTIVFADQEPEMISILLKKIALQKAPRAQAICADICALDFGRSFDLILVPHDAFLVLTRDEDIDSALRGLRQHLHFSGKLMIDVALLGARSINSKDLPKCYDLNIPDHEWRVDLDISLDSKTRLIRKTRHQHTSDLIRFDFLYRVLVGNEEIDTYGAEMTIRRHTYSGFEAHIVSAGFNIVERFCNYERKPFQQSDSRIIYLLEREG